MTASEIAEKATSINQAMNLAEASADTLFVSGYFDDRVRMASKMFYLELVVSEKTDFGLSRGGDGNWNISVRKNIDSSYGFTASYNEEGWKLETTHRDPDYVTEIEAVQFNTPGISISEWALLITIPTPIQ